MSVLILAFVGVFAGLVGIVRLWQRNEAMIWIAAGIGLTILAGLICFTAELWYDLFGFNRGDGQVFIGYFLVGAGALLGAAGIGVIAAIVAALRRNSPDEV